MSETKSKVKKSFILSGLIGTGGFFIAKMLGLVYAIPFAKILGSDSYMSYYGTAYRIYSYVLNVFTAGMPLAIAAIVAKYMAREDYLSVSRVKKLAFYVLLCTGFIGMLLMMGLSYFIAPVLAINNDQSIVLTTLMILSLAILFVPILSWIRGYYQGHKEMQQYAFSQVFEQIFRVGFLLSAAALCVYVFKMERKWALYASVASTSVAAIAAILQFIVFDRKQRASFAQLVATQNEEKVESKKLLKELLLLALPYLLQAILGYSDDIIYSTIVPSRLNAYGYSEQMKSVILSSFNYVGVKLNAIPMILAPGFITAIIPHISEALEKKDYQKISDSISDALNTVLFIGTPIAFCIFLYAGGLYHTLFYTEDLVTSTSALRWISIDGFFSIIAPVVASTMMALGLRKSILKRQIIFFLTKIILMYPLIAIFGYPGILLASMVGYLYLILASLWEIRNKFSIHLKETAIVCIKIAIGLVLMAISFILLNSIGLNALEGSKLIGFTKMIINGLCTVIIYAGYSWLVKLPQQIFHLKKEGIVSNKAV